MHSLLSILKIAGILLLVLLLLLIFLLFFVLFVPFCYRIYAYVPEKTSGDRGRWQHVRAKVTVHLLWLVMISWEYAEGKGKGVFRILGIPVARTGGGKKNKKEAVTLSEEQAKAKETELEKDSEFGSETVSGEERKYDSGFDHWEPDAPKLEDCWEETSQDGEKSRDGEYRLSFWRSVKRFWEKVCDLPKWFLKARRRILQYVQGISDFGKDIRRIGKSFADTWNDQHVRDGVFIIWQQCRRLSVHLKPRRICGKIHFGCSDPAATGQLLGVLGIIYAFSGNTVRIEPDFEQTVFDGKLEITGRIRVFTLISIAWKLYRDREVRYFLKKIKNISKGREE